METDGIEGAIDRLHAVRPADFVRERAAVAKALKAAGRRDEAARVEKLPRPTLSVWAVNQLARHVPGLVARLSKATADLQGGGAGNYAGALTAHRDALNVLREKAEELLEASGLRPAPDLLARVVHDLRAGILDPANRALIESGRLVHDVGDEGTVNPFEQELAERPPAAATSSREPDTSADSEAARRAQARADEAARAAHLRRLEQLRQAVASAEAARDRDAAAVEEARRALADAERKLEASRAAVLAAGTALESARSNTKSS